MRSIASTAASSTGRARASEPTPANVLASAYRPAGGSSALCSRSQALASN